MLRKLRTKFREVLGKPNILSFFFKEARKLGNLDASTLKFCLSPYHVARQS